MISGVKWQATRRVGVIFRVCILALLANFGCTLSVLADVVIILPEHKPPYSLAAQAIVSKFQFSGRTEVVRSITLDEYKQATTLDSPAKGTDLLITLGVDAAQYQMDQGAVANQKPHSFISSFVTRSALSALRDTYSESPLVDYFLAGVVLDQPVSRYINLLSVAMPSIRSVAVVLGPQSAHLLPELLLAEQQQGWELNVQVLGEKQKVLKVLNSVFRKSDVLLVLPDRANFNQSLAKLAIALSTRYRKPIVAYSDAYTQVGALVSMFSSPEKIGEQTAEIAMRHLDGELLKKGQHHAPKGFDISINPSVERALRVNLKDVEQLGSDLTDLERSEP